MTFFTQDPTLAKFDRIGWLATARTEVDPARYPLWPNCRRLGLDRLRASVDSNEYQGLWLWGEAWCQEPEVYHNPRATNPIPFALTPGATHWFERNREVECSTTWANSVISSITHLRMEGDRV